MKYGPNSAEVEAFIANIGKLTPEQLSHYAARAADAAAYADAADAAYYAAYAAYAAYADAAAAAWHAAEAARAAYAEEYEAVDAAAYATEAEEYEAVGWIFRYAAWALAFKPLVRKYDFTQEHYDMLTEIVLVINPEATEEELQALAYRTDSKFTLRGLVLHSSITEDLKVLIAMRLGGMK